MPTTPLRLALRASGGAHARSTASVTEVWAVLADPQRWAEFEPFLGDVTPMGGSPADPVAGTDQPPALRAGQRLFARLRFLPFELPVEVDHVVSRSTLAVTSRLLPGLTEEVEHLLIPASSGGAVVTVRLTLHGPLAVPALIPRLLLRTLTVRLLARAAERSPSADARGVSSVA